MSLVSSINIVQQALSANQAAITTVSNNIANIDTEGYSKLRVNLASVGSYGVITNNPESVANSLSGVEVASVQRYSDFYAQSYCWQENSTASYLDQYSQSATNIENLTNSLNGSGLASAFTKFYDAADTLSNSPGDLTARQNYAAAADSLCSVFNNLSSNLTTLQQSLVGTSGSVYPSQLSDKINQANDLINQIADVNENIVKTNMSGQSSPTLLDQRDSLVTKLSALMPVSAKENPNGTINISLDNMSLVEGQNVKGHLSADNGVDVNGHIITNMSIVDTKGVTQYPNVNSSIDAGSIGAILDVSGTNSTKLTISGVMDTIDNLATQFATVFNDIQLNANASGTPLCIQNGTPKTLTPATQAMFTAKDGAPTIKAGNISVNAAISNDPYLIAASRTDTASASYKNTDIGNNSNMSMVLAARTTTTYTNLDGMDMEDYLASAVSKIGSDVDNLTTSLKTQKTVLSQAQTNLAAATGVNMNEELTDLMKYQQAYQAAARVFSTCNTLLDNLINLGK